MSDDGDIEYEMLEPFDIEEGEFDGLTVDHIFALGVEFEMVRNELDTGREVKRTVHTENVERFKKMAARRGRDASFAGMGDELLDSQWSLMTVEAM